MTNPSDVQIFAGIISLTLLWGVFPFALYSIVNENAGVLVTYIILGVCCAAARTAMGLTVLSLVASRCESEQISFKGCYVARDVLPCLQNSTCSSDILSDFNNDLPVGFSKCYAWGTNKCDNAGDVNNIGFTTFSVLQFILDVLTSCVPVYSGFLYLMRLEGSRVGELNQDNNILEGSRVGVLNRDTILPLVHSANGKDQAKTLRSV